MKENYFDFYEIVKKLANDFNIKDYRTESGKEWFFIYTRSNEIQFSALQGLQDDLKDYNFELFSIDSFRNYGLLKLNILNKNY